MGCSLDELIRVGMMDFRLAPNGQPSVATMLAKSEESHKNQQIVLSNLARYVSPRCMHRIQSWGGGD